MPPPRTGGCGRSVPPQVAQPTRRRLPAAHERRSCLKAAPKNALLIWGRRLGSALAVALCYPVAGLWSRGGLSSPGGPFGHYIDLSRGRRTMSEFRAFWKTTFSTPLITGLRSTALLGYPLPCCWRSVALLHPPTKHSASLVLVPFWTPASLCDFSRGIVFVRASMECCNGEACPGFGLPTRSSNRLFNGVGVIIEMVHVWLPYMVLSFQVP